MAAIPATHAHFTRHSKKKTSDSLLVDPVLVEEKEIQLGYNDDGVNFGLEIKTLLEIAASEGNTTIDVLLKGIPTGIHILSIPGGAGVSHEEPEIEDADAEADSDMAESEEDYSTDDDDDPSTDDNDEEAENSNEVFNLGEDEEVAEEEETTPTDTHQVAKPAKRQRQTKRSVAELEADKAKKMVTKIAKEMKKLKNQVEKEAKKVKKIEERVARIQSKPKKKTLPSYTIFQVTANTDSLLNDVYKT